jgi:hypothetical protein
MKLRSYFGKRFLGVARGGVGWIAFVENEIGDMGCIWVD